MTPAAGHTAGVPMTGSSGAGSACSLRDGVTLTACGTADGAAQQLSSPAAVMGGV